MSGAAHFIHRGLHSHAPVAYRAIALPSAAEYEELLVAQRNGRASRRYRTGASLRRAIMMHLDGSSWYEIKQATGWSAPDLAHNQKKMPARFFGNSDPSILSARPTHGAGLTTGPVLSED